MYLEEKKTAAIFKAFCDENRIRILKLLRSGEKCGCRLLEEIHVTQPTLSHHMKVLAECGLICSRKEWKNTYYSLNCETLTAFRNYIGTLTCRKGRACSCMDESGR